MDTSFSNQNNIPDDEREAFIKALVSYYSGLSPIRAAFDPVEPGLIDRYYRRKKKYPDEMEEIEQEAAAKARQERSISIPVTRSPPPSCFWKWHRKAFSRRNDVASHFLR